MPSWEVLGLDIRYMYKAKLQGQSYFYKAASIQILIADTINQPSMLNDKLKVR